MAQQGGDQFYSALQAQATAAVGAIINSPLMTIQYPSQGDFMWNWQNGNQVFNQSTWDYISAKIAKGDFTGSAQLSAAGGYPNAYATVLNSMAYTLSKSNQALLIQTQANASQQASTVVQDYQTTYGEITAAQMSAAKVSTKYDYVVGYICGSVWSGAAQPLSYSTMAGARNLAALLPNRPASSDQVITDVSLYLSMMQPVLALQDATQNGQWVLSQLTNNTQNPNSSNGGINTVNPNTGNVSTKLTDAFGINYATQSIANDLQNTGRTIQIGMTTSAASGSQLNVSMQAQAGFSVGSCLKFSVSGGATYDMSTAQGTSTDMSITMTWAGYSVVPMAPLAWQQATNVGWFWLDPIIQALANTGVDVDGYHFIATQPYNLGSLTSGGDFGLLNNLLIANYPTVSITYRNANYKSFKQAWSEHVSGNLTLFGFIKLGSFSEGAYGSSFQQGADNSTFTVTFSASPQVVAVPALQQTAYVIAGAVTTVGN
jgi:hypothetical protein